MAYVIVFLMLSPIWLLFGVNVADFFGMNMIVGVVFGVFLIFIVTPLIPFIVQFVFWGGLSKVLGFFEKLNSDEAKEQKKEKKKIKRQRQKERKKYTNKTYEEQMELYNQEHFSEYYSK